MRRLIPLGLVALSLSFSSPVEAQDVTGTWELTWETPRGTRTTTVVLVQDRATVTGTAQWEFMGRPGGGGGGETREIEVSDGTMEGDKLTFSLSMGFRDRTFTQTFTATVSGDSMEGTMTTPRGENPFTGRRTGA